MISVGDMLSQAEIDALLNGSASLDLDSSSANEESLSSQEIDALGEIGNISMGTSATTLFTLLGQKVLITTPQVKVTTWDEMAKEYIIPYVGVRVEYTHGLVGTNLLILKEHDVKVITDLMMGGTGTNVEGELSDLHLSAISEAMNQMVGSSSTSMSSMLGERIDISPPKAFTINFNSDQPYAEFKGSQRLVKIAFKMIIGELIDSEIMQILPLNFAKELVKNLLKASQKVNEEAAETKKQTQQADNFNSQQPQQSSENYRPGGANIPQPNQSIPGVPQPEPSFMYQEQPNIYNEPSKNKGYINVQPAHFQAFDEGRIEAERKNISLIMDVPLQITVELGRTQRMIKDILEFGQGSIIELDKLAGEPVDILVNGKQIAKGEVVVIDESFGVRITDIIHPSKRL
jgi:flagellar motor switch protein FliN